MSPFLSLSKVSSGDRLTQAPNTPRSLIAMERCGVDPRDLVYASPMESAASLSTTGFSAEDQAMIAGRREKMRQMLLDIALEEYAAVKAELSSGASRPEPSSPESAPATPVSQRALRLSTSGASHTSQTSPASPGLGGSGSQDVSLPDTPSQADIRKRAIFDAERTFADRLRRDAQQLLAIDSADQQKEDMEQRAKSVKTQRLSASSRLSQEQKERTTHVLDNFATLQAELQRRKREKLARDEQKYAQQQEEKRRREHEYSVRSRQELLDKYTNSKRLDDAQQREVSRRRRQTEQAYDERIRQLDQQKQEEYKKLRAQLDEEDAKIRSAQAARAKMCRRETAEAARSFSEKMERSTTRLDALDKDRRQFFDDRQAKSARSQEQVRASYVSQIKAEFASQTKAIEDKEVRSKSQRARHDQDTRQSLAEEMLKREERAMMVAVEQRRQKYERKARGEASGAVYQQHSDKIERRRGQQAKVRECSESMTRIRSMLNPDNVVDTSGRLNVPKEIVKDLPEGSYLRYSTYNEALRAFIRDECPATPTGRSKSRSSPRGGSRSASRARSRGSSLRGTPTTGGADGRHRPMREPADSPASVPPTTPSARGGAVSSPTQIVAADA